MYLLEIDEIFDRLYDFYKVSTITDLAAKLEMSQPAITNWQRRNSISAIKKRCRELGIYKEIFGNFDLNRNIQKIDQISDSNNSQLNFGNQINNVNNKISGVDKLTLDILKAAYQKAIENDDLKGLRKHLIEY